MAARRALVAVLLLAPVIAGCVTPAGLDKQSTPQEGVLDADAVKVPDGATMSTLPNGVALVWENIALPFNEPVTIPEGTTLVRASVKLTEDNRVGVAMQHAETGRRRCNTPYVDAWNIAVTGEATCSGLTAVDDLPAEWKVRAFAASPIRIDPMAPTALLSSNVVAEHVRVEFLSVPLDGPVAALDLSQLSKLEYEVSEPEVAWIEAHDGAELYAEVTLPKGEGPWPTIIASSPYNAPAHEAGKPSMWEYFTKDWAMRGYAVVNVDVRGFGNSGGCVEVWGPNEQKDQATIVEWVAAQAWSDGNVGFYGQSYVGTTPVAAAVQAPDALKAIIAVAPVINAYDDWHFGGVPNGENVASPAAYQTYDAGYIAPDPLQIVKNHAASLCDPTLSQRANDPRAVYDAFYEERNFSARAGNVKAAVLYTEGFEDSNVKSSMITHWFNALDAPKLGLFGHWVHQHPVRADQEVLFLAWMDQYVKGRPLGFEDVPPVAVVTNDGRHRTTDAWPEKGLPSTVLHADFDAGALAADAKDGSTALVATPVSGSWPATEAPLPTDVVLETPLDAPLYVTGDLRLHVKAELAGAENAHLAAFLYDDGPEESVLVTWGMFNLAHRNGHDRYEPVAPGEVVDVDLPFLPTEHAFAEGHTLRLVIRAADVNDWFVVNPAEPGRVTLHGGEGGTALHLPTLAWDAAEPLPVTAVP